MAVVAMEKISVCALKTNRKAILETLQGLGVMQVVTDELDDPELLKMDTAEAKARFDKNADLADQAVALALDGIRAAGNNKVVFRQGKRLGKIGECLVGAYACFD